MKTLVLLGAGLLSALIVFLTNSLALLPWRHAANAHWSERARLYHPVRMAAVSNLWMVPMVFTLGLLFVLGEDSPHWALIAIVTALGTTVGTLPLNLEVFRRVPRAVLMRQTAVSWWLRFLLWFVFLTAAAFMPSTFNVTCLIIGAMVLSLLIFWNRSGWIWLGRKVGLFSAPPDRLQKIVQQTAAQMNVRVQETWLMRSFVAQAYAMPARGTLIFSERLLELLSEEEITAVCAHELGHLSETRRSSWQRYVIWLMFYPWIFFRPVVETFEMPGFLLLLLTTVLAPALYRQISHKLELRADSIAKANEPNAGVYARALERLYEDSLVPAVNAKNRATHPHLYDRLIQAGVTPDFPRPAAPPPMAWNGVMFSFLLGILIALLITYKLFPL